MMKAAGVPLSQNHDPDDAKPGNKPGFDLLDKDEVEPKRPSMWNIVIYNDDYTPMEFVEFILMTVFHIPKLDALALTLAVHTKAGASLEPEIAEQKQCEIILLTKIEEHPLGVEVERV
jgi:ATP-dependent Clp protease adaptor protein ClpS